MMAAMTDVRALADFLRHAQDGLSADQLLALVDEQFPGATAKEIAWAVEEARAGIRADIDLSKEMLGAVPNILEFHATVKFGRATDAFRAAGLSLRAASALARIEVQDLSELCARSWEGEDGLRIELLRVPNCGVRSVEEIGTLWSKCGSGGGVTS
jgi:hypothetical protein